MNNIFTKNNYVFQNKKYSEERSKGFFSLFHIFLMCDLKEDSEMLISASVIHLPYIILAEAYEDMWSGRESAF